MNTTFSLPGGEDYPGLTPLEIWCVHPVSGLYTQFQRELFAVVILILLFFQFHPWLTAGALLYAVTYSVIATLHGFFLAVRSNSMWDADLFATQNLTQLSIYATLIIVAFSPRILDQDATIFYLVWCCLMFLSRNIVAAATSVEFSIKDNTVMMTCEAGLCTNPCANMTRTSLFRTPNDPLQPVVWTWGDVRPTVDFNNTSNAWLLNAPVRSEKSFVWLTNVWLWYTFLGPAIMLFYNDATEDPRWSRNKVFHRLHKHYVPRHDDYSKPKLYSMYVLCFLRYLRIGLLVLVPELYVVEILIAVVIWVLFKTCGRTLPRFHDLAVLEISSSRTRYVFAKTIAILWFVLIRLGKTLVAGSLIFLSVKMEMASCWIPESESWVAVGQWGSWATLALTTVAALVHRLLKGESLRKRHEIFLDDEDCQDHEPARIRRMYKALEKEAWTLPRYLASHLIFEWVEIKYWWNNTVMASEINLNAPEELEAQRKKEQKEKKRKTGKTSSSTDAAEKGSFDGFDDMPIEYLRDLSTMPCRENVEEYDYEQDEEFQRFLHDTVYHEGKAERARQKVKLEEYKKRIEAENGQNGWST
jgi:hypothetical protein